MPAAHRSSWGGYLDLVVAADRPAEVRAALRWLKARLLRDGMPAGEVALLARSIAPYRPFILQTAAEFGLPIRLVDGLPLRSNPAVAALLDLLRLLMPASGSDEPALPRRLVVEAWRCPYFDWEDGITARDAEALDAAARRGQVFGGLSQWQAALALPPGSRTMRPARTKRMASPRARPPRRPTAGCAPALTVSSIPCCRCATATPTVTSSAGWRTLIGPDPARAPLVDAGTGRPERGAARPPG